MARSVIFFCFLCFLSFINGIKSNEKICKFYENVLDFLRADIDREESFYNQAVQDYFSTAHSKEIDSYLSKLRLELRRPKGNETICEDQLEIEMETVLNECEFDPLIYKMIHSKKSYRNNMVQYISSIYDLLRKIHELSCESLSAHDFWKDFIDVTSKMLLRRVDFMRNETEKLNKLVKSKDLENKSKNLMEQLKLNKIQKVLGQHGCITIDYKS